MNDFVIVKEIGRGSYGSALKAQRKSSLSHVVIKSVDLTGLSSKEASDAINEVCILKQLRHPYIVKLFDHFVDTGKLCLVLEYADGGDLSSKLTNSRTSGKFLTEPQISRWFTQLLLGLSYIHSKNIMHRDLKPQNLFISLKGDRILIGDYGTCKMLPNKQSLAQTTAGTPFCAWYGLISNFIF